MEKLVPELKYRRARTQLYLIDKDIDKEIRLKIEQIFLIKRTYAMFLRKDMPALKMF